MENIKWLIKEESTLSEFSDSWTAMLRKLTLQNANRIDHHSRYVDESGGLLNGIFAIEEDDYTAIFHISDGGVRSVYRIKTVAYDFESDWLSWENVDVDKRGSDDERTSRVKSGKKPVACVDETWITQNKTIGELFDIEKLRDVYMQYVSEELEADDINRAFSIIRGKAAIYLEDIAAKGFYKALGIDEALSYDGLGTIILKCLVLGYPVQFAMIMREIELEKFMRDCERLTAIAAVEDDF